jgi:hypothetical protein
LHLQQPSVTPTAPPLEHHHNPQQRKPPQRELCALSEPGPASATAGSWNLITELESHRGLYTVAELAKVLRKSASSVYRMAWTKQIPSLIIGGSRMFDPATLAMHFRRKYPQLAEAARHVSRAA